MHEVIFTKGKRVMHQKYVCVWGSGWVFACTTQSWTMQWIYCCDCIPLKINIKLHSFVKSHSQAKEVNCHSQCPNILVTQVTHCTEILKQQWVVAILQVINFVHTNTQTLGSIYGVAIRDWWTLSNWQENLSCDSLSYAHNLSPGNDRKKEKKVIVDFCKQRKLGITFKSWQSSFFGAYSDQHHNQYPGILNLAFQSTRVHTMSLCSDARVCEIESCYYVPRSLKPITKVCCDLLNVLNTENMYDIWFCVMSL